MSRSSSRKYKRYRETHPRKPNGDTTKQPHHNVDQGYFGDVAPRREDGVIDLTPYAAALGLDVIATAHFDIGRIVTKRRGRPPKQRAL